MQLSCIVVVQPLSCFQLFSTLWTAACQAPLFSTVSQSLLKFMSNESVILSHLVQLLSGVPLFAPPWTAAGQAPLSSTISWSLLKFMSNESVMLSNHLIRHPTIHSVISHQRPREAKRMPSKRRGPVAIMAVALSRGPWVS